MVWPGAGGPDAPPHPPVPGGEYSENIPRHPMRPGMRPGFFPYPRRGMHMRGGFFPPRPFHPGQNYMNQRKGRPPWGPRPRPPLPPPHFVPAPMPEGFLPFPPQVPPPWSQPPPPPPPPPESQTEADTTSELTSRKKKKRASNGTSRPWDKDAAEKAHSLELECQRNANAKSIVIRFPDPELSKEIVQGFHSTIDNVHFQGPCGGRYCFVTLKDDADVEKVMDDINKIKFGVGFLNAERKVQKPEENACCENIDPFTLYVGNLALNITVSEVKEKFPSAARIDVGHAKKMKNTRYAFVKFSTAEAALEAYKASVNTIMASRSIIVRFRRHKAPVGPPGEKPTVPEPKAVEKLTVGAKLKAKKELKAAKEAAEAESRIDIPKIVIKDEVESEEEVEMENDEESLSEYEVEDFDAEAEDDDDEMDHIDQASESEDEYDMSGDDYEDTDDDDRALPTTRDDDDEYDNDDDDNDEFKDVFSLTFDKFNQ